MEDPEWRGLYHFPMANEDSLKYDTYTKKVYINKTVTEKCEDGCYVLISIISNLQYYGHYEDESTPYRISINPRIFNSDEILGNPKVKMEVNEFVIGNIDFSSSNTPKMDYYTLVLPYESPYILFDWQADRCSFYINIGTTRPDKDNADFPFNTIGYDYVYKIDKEEILEKKDVDQYYKDNKIIRGLTLTIGVYSDSPDTLKSSPYAFKIFMPPTVDDEYKLASEIIHIRTDQKVQCLPFKYNTTNICVFATIFDEMDFNHNLVLYPRSGAPDLTIRGKIIDSEKIERNDVNEIMKVMGEINTENDCLVQKKYVYLDKIEKGKTYVFIVNIGKNENIIEILSSTIEMHEDFSLFPNPSSVQLFALQDYDINLNFVTTKDLLINIVCLAGEANIYWGGVEPGKEVKYYLSGFEDRLTLTSGTSDLETRLAALHVKSTTPTSVLKEGFVFYISYYPRGVMDQLSQDRNIEIHYRTVSMPLAYFVPIDKINSNLVNFNFYEFSITKQPEISYDTRLFNIWATVIGNETIAKARYDKTKLPKYDKDKCVNGIIDLNFGTLYFSSEFVKIPKLCKVFFRKKTFFFHKENDGNNFETMGLELSIHSDYLTDGNNYIPEGIYFNGKLLEAYNQTVIYNLRYTKDKPNIRLEFSTVSDSVKYIITTDKKSKTSDSSITLNEKQEYGRKIIDINAESLLSQNKQLYLKIFTIEQNLKSNLDDYVFKYTSNKTFDSFKPFNSADKSELDITKNKNIYHIKFNPVENRDASYYIKAIYKRWKIDGEKYDSIAISESQGKYKITEIKPYKNEKLSLDLEVEPEVSYIKVIARVNIGTEKYFFAYTPKDCSNLPNDEGESTKSNDDDNKLILYVSIGVGSFLVIVVIILVIFVVWYRGKNKNLMEQVNKISFVQSGAAARADDDNLLLGTND